MASPSSPDLRLRPSTALAAARRLFRNPEHALKAFRNAGKAAWMPGLDWEDLLGRDLETPRRILGVRTPAAYLELKS